MPYRPTWQVQLRAITNAKNQEALDRFLFETTLKGVAPMRDLAREVLRAIHDAPEDVRQFWMDRCECCDGPHVPRWKGLAGE